jgi:hypothetical protein
MFDPLAILVFAIVIIFGLLLIWKSVKFFIINAVVGLTIIFLINLLGGVDIAYSWLVILICAMGGVLGALMVTVLHFLGISL